MRQSSSQSSMDSRRLSPGNRARIHAISRPPIGHCNRRDDSGTNGTSTESSTLRSGIESSSEHERDHCQLDNGGRNRVAASECAIAKTRDTRLRFTALLFVVWVDPETRKTGCSRIKGVGKR
ncbi:hypothetical protein RE6C_01275 [Rhodopirellula europaea 6C]|uniref:Uncharacterized protein n=1 Tax=Rhodopirellula europaea 6C TaxID=1263867 RepID=M2B726_9BACT|nr:hypothetical protein RE6C_01275 [Rhodopirellula europaea 6C]